MSERSEARAAQGGSARARAVVLIVLLASFAALKLVQTPPEDYYGPDGGTYFQVARHVAEGDGLVTSISLYHQGLKHLPSPTTIYPLWPLVLGYAGRLIGLEHAARLLPELLYLIDLALLYALTNRLASAWGRAGRLFGSLPIDLGHVALLLFGLNPIFVRYSSLPYTEPLALGFTFAALLLLGRVVASRGPLVSALCGAFAGAAYLARTSMIAVPVAVLATVAIAALSDARARRALVAAAIGVAVVVVPWLAYLASFVDRLRPMMLVDVFTVYRETPELAPIVWIVPVRSLGDLCDFVVRGLVAAFRYGGPSYVRSFGVIAYVVPLALVCVLASRRLRAAFAHSDQRLLILGAALCGLGLAAMAHAAHSESDFARLWAFDHRHGLPFVVLIVSALACLLPLVRPDAPSPGLPRRAQPALRAVVLLLIALSLVASARKSYGEFFRQRGRSPTGPERELAAWLAAQPRLPVVISSRAPKLAVTSRAGFHWIDCADDPEQVRILFALAGADYLVVRRSDRRCAFMQGLDPELERVATFKHGRPPLELFRWRGGVRG